MVEVNQKKIDQARHALQFLRNISIIWPNSASEVLLAGSFDGWTTQVQFYLSPSVHQIRHFILYCVRSIFTSYDYFYREKWRNLPQASIPSA